MHVGIRRAAAGLAAGCWIAVIIFCIAGIKSGFGFTPNMSRFFNVMLAVAVTASLTAVTGHVITPLIAGRSIGARAQFRAVRDEAAQGRHAKDDTDARVYDFKAFQ